MSLFLIQDMAKHKMKKITESKSNKVKKAIKVKRKKMQTTVPSMQVLSLPLAKSPSPNTTIRPEQKESPFSKTIRPEQKPFTVNEEVAAKPDAVKRCKNI